MVALQNKTIYVFQYAGYNGGFARTRSLMWKCLLVGVDGARRHGGDWMSEGYGYKDKQYADKDASDWATFLGWPIVNLGRCEDFDDRVKEF